MACSLLQSTSVQEKQKLLETNSVAERMEKCMIFLKREREILKKMGNDEGKGGLGGLTRRSTSYSPLAGLGGSSLRGRQDKEDIENIKKKLEGVELPEETKQIVEREIKKLEKMSENNSEYAVSLRYLETLADLPWNKSSEEVNDVERAKEILNKDHFGLEKVKKRIIQFLAVRNLKMNHQGSIICFLGPPGVGKTSLGKSIAQSLGRKFYRVSLGGVRDEAEIRGHRRTYVGSIPGVIIQSVLKVKTNNPVFLLDEIDKLGKGGWNGDPQSAMLEVLDPAQNNTFSDHYLATPFDLSKVMFIATANSLDSLHPALLDRMEVIEIPGYSVDEKVHIADRYLVKR